jgi:glycosyltransferase involved in cell wall biosynthesis
VRLAWFTPFSHQSAIGECSTIVLRELARHVGVTVFASDIPSAREARSHEFDLRLLWGADADDVARDLRHYDGVVYNLGNHYAMHHRSYEVAQRCPGVVVLHDLVMHHLFAERYLGPVPNHAGYLAELEYAHGEAGRRMGELILSGGAGPLVWDSPTMLELHMARSAVRGSLGVIVHSRFAEQAVREVAPVPVMYSAFPTPAGFSARPAPPRRRADGPLRLLTIGMVNRNKLIDEVIRVIGASDVLRERVVYQVVGEYAKNVSYYDRLSSTIDELGLAEVVHLLGYQTDAAMREYLDAADVVINLRFPHFGEGSWSLLETAFAGKTVVVWRHGFYDEFPDDALAKVSSMAELQTVLERLCASEADRVSLARRLEAYARATFVTRDYAQRLLAFNEACRYNAPALHLADFTALRLRELGGTAADVSTIERVARAVAEVTGVFPQGSAALSATRNGEP